MPLLYPQRSDPTGYSSFAPTVSPSYFVDVAVLDSGAPLVLPVVFPGSSRTGGCNHFQVLLVPMAPTLRLTPTKAHSTVSLPSHQNSVMTHHGTVTASRMSNSAVDSDFGPTPLSPPPARPTVSAVRTPRITQPRQLAANEPERPVEPARTVPIGHLTITTIPSKRCH